MRRGGRYAIHRDLLCLRAFGGWAGVAQVQVYAHLLAEVYTAEAAEWLGLDSSASRAIATKTTD